MKQLRKLKWSVSTQPQIPKRFNIIFSQFAYAFDSDDKLVKLLGDGTIAALVVQDPFRMGYEGVKTAFAASKGEKVPATVDTGVNVITKENMNTPRSQELLSPKIK